MGIYTLPVTWNLVWHRLMKLHFIRRHTFQHCLDMFKHQRFKPQLTNMDIMEFKLFDMYQSLCKLIALYYRLRFQPSHLFLHLIFSSASEMWDQYDNILPCNILLTMLLCLDSYEQYCTLLKVLLQLWNKNWWKGLYNNMSLWLATAPMNL